MTVRASFQGTVVAESDRTVVVEGNQYFPLDDVRPELLEPTATRTTCPPKGEASYYDVVLDGHRIADAAWYYPAPKEAASAITDRVAFWKGVEISHQD